MSSDGRASFTSVAELGLEAVFGNRGRREGLGQKCGNDESIALV